jgi:two-component system nitrogen regulation sensor histidine kinase GlnL
MEQDYSFTIDSKLRIRSWEDGIFDLIGPAPFSLLDKKYYEVFPKVYIEDRDALFSCMRRNRVFVIKDYCLKFPGSQMIADIKIKPLPKNPDNGVRGARVSIVPKSRCPLAIELYSSQRLIDIGKIASLLAHGVRNPLNAIKGAVVYLGEKYSGEPTLVEFTKIIDEEISRLDNFISKFLSTSISEFGTEADLNAVVRKIEMFTMLQARAHRIKANYIYGEVPQVVMNSFHLEQAILNIINNAMEAMPAGGSLTVKTSPRSRADRDYAIIEISDTGPGLADTRMDDLAKPGGKKGKGFGLFITREVLRSHGGHLEIKSARGSGTAVMLYLPAKNSF